MKIQFLGGNREVTGSRTLLTMPNGLKILIDFGMVQANEGKFEEVYRQNAREFEFNPEEIDYLILTHGHIDHFGSTPLLIKRGFKGKIISTAPVGEFATISFPDTARIMESDIIRANKIRPKNKLEPLFSEDEAKLAAGYIQCYDYNREIVLDENTTLELKCAGHMLGASMPLITCKDGYKTKKILFTGDTSAKSNIHPFLKVADDIGEVDYIVCESTYGNRVHKKTDTLEVLERSIRETCIDRNKTLVIPVFSLQRSSEILWLLREVYIENPKFNKIPIYLDSPMAVSSQEVMDRHREYWGEKWLERDKELGNLFNWDVAEYIKDYKESLALANGNPKVILSSSGMCDAGRIQNHLISFLPSKGCKILFTGYLAEGSLGRRILETKHKTISINRRQVVIRAELEQVSFSGHADVNQMIEFLKTSDKNRLKKIFLNHGDYDASLNLKKEIKKHMKVDVEIPKYMGEFKL